MKNLAKWRVVRLISAPFTHAFRTIKTPHEADEEEGATRCTYSHENGALVVAMARMALEPSPPSSILVTRPLFFDLWVFECGGVAYRKSPTV